VGAEVPRFRATAAGIAAGARGRGTEAVEERRKAIAEKAAAFHARSHCWDNAAQESVFGKVQIEHVRDRVYATKEEAKLDLFCYIEVFYNRIRRHAALGYVAPAEFEARGIKGAVA